MAKRTANIRARTEPGLKQKAEKILRLLGLSPSDAINIFYQQVVLHKGIPFPINLEVDDDENDYTEIKDIDHLKTLIAYEE